MKKLLVLILCLCGIGLALFFAGVVWQNHPGFLAAPAAPKKITPHAYNDPATDISKIDLKIFYVVPNNLAADPAWHSEISGILNDEIKFHSIQFHNLSALTAELYPNPVVLEHEDVYYDTTNTDLGNPQGLRNIVPELERRYPEFLKSPPGAYTAIAIIYEGVGASGAPNAMILSRTFLAKDEYKLVGKSLFYHEFAHTFGLPDSYDLTNNQPYSDDIMGAGRYKPFDTNYISPDLLAGLGLNFQNK